MHVDQSPLPENEVSRLSLTARYLILSSGEAFSKVCVLLAFAYLARVLGPHRFGLIELSLSVTVFFVLTSEFGLGSLGARQVAARPADTPKLIAGIVLVRVALAAIGYVAILTLSARYGRPGIGLLAIYGVSVLCTPLFLQWVFQGLGRMRWVAAGTALRNLVFAALVFAFVRPGSDVRLVAIAEVLGVLALVGFNVIGVTRRLRIAPDWHEAVPNAKRVFREAWSLGASEITWAGLWYSPTIVLGALQDPIDVAWLAGPLRIVLALHTFVWLYFFNLLPGLSRATVEGVEAWRDLANRSLRTSMWIGCLVAAGFALLAPLVIQLLYGPGYTRAVLPLQIVVWMIPVAWLSGHFRYSLIASGHQRYEFMAAAITAAVSLVLSVLLVPTFGSLGAGVALVIGGVVNAVIAGLAMNRVLGALDLRHALVQPLSICVVCLLGGFAVNSVAGPIVAAFLCSTAYALVASRQDRELVRLRRVWIGR